jgi:hypothetical protein
VLHLVTPQRDGAGPSSAADDSWSSPLTVSPLTASQPSPTENFEVLAEAWYRHMSGDAGKPTTMQSAMKLSMEILQGDLDSDNDEQS